MSWCCQIRCTMWPLPSFVTYSNRICHWSIELLINIFVSPIHMTLLLKVLWCFHIALSSCRASFSWCPKLHNQVNWGHKNKEISFAFWYYQGHLHWDNSQQNLLCGNEPHIFLWWTFFHKENSLLCKDVSSAFQVITAINSHTIYYKEQWAFSNLCIIFFENVIV